MSWEDVEFPEGWRVVQAGDVTEIVGGGTPKTNVPGNFTDDGGHPWITPADLTGYTKKYISRGRRNLTDQGLHTSSAKYMPTGTVLFSSRAPIGYVAIASNPVTTNQGFRSFAPSDKIDPQYLYYALKLIRRDAEQLASGTTFAELSGSKAKRLLFPLAPIAVQRQVVQILDRATASTTTAATHLRAAKRAVERLRQGVLAAACSGRLTAEWREGYAGETADCLVENIGDQRSSVLRKKNNKAAEPAPCTFEVPEGWVIASLDRLSVRITSGSRDWSQFYGRGSGTFVMAQNVRRGYLDWSFRQAVDPPDGDASRERSQVAPGDLLVTIVGANTGDAGPVTEAHEEHYVCQSVALVRPVLSKIGPFLNLWFNSPEHGRGYFEACIYGAGRPHLSFDQLKAAPVAVPPLDEQRRRSCSALIGC